MTVVLSALLVLTPFPIQPEVKEKPWSSSSTRASSTLSVAIVEPWLHLTDWPSASSLPPVPTSPTSLASIEMPANNETPSAGSEPATTSRLPSLRERALGKLTELGAPAWVVGAFDCIGARESGWANVRSRTGDSGVLQINDVHWPELNRRGLDPWVPEDAATFAWMLFTRAGWSFRDWTVRGLCGLR